MEDHSGYIVLARKYRPQRFSDVAGQTVTVQTLQNALRSGRLAHAFLFSGPRGVGKTTLARLLARALNCQKEVTEEPCGKCESCREVAEGRSLDVLEIDGASNNKVEEARQLRETVRYAPARDRYRVFIIDEVHMLSVAAFNALLKTLEEPPSHIKFIFATTEIHKIPATILSRCQHHEFRRLSREEITAQIAGVCKQEELRVEDRALDLIARSAGGSLRDALSALDQVAARCGNEVKETDARGVLGLIPDERVLGIFEAAASQDLAALLRISREIFEEGCDPARFCEEILAQARDLLVHKLSPQSGEQGDWVGVAQAEDRQKLAERLTTEQLVRLFQLFFDLEQRLRGASLPQILLEMVCVKLVHLADLRPIEEILGELRGGRSGGAATRSSGSPRLATPPAPAPGSLQTQAPSAGSTDPSPPAPAGNGPARERFLEVLHQKKLHLASFIESARAITPEGSALVISFGPDQRFIHDKAAEDLPLLREAARAALGDAATVRLNIEETGGDGPAAQATSPGEQRDRLIEKVVKEPIVQSALDIFGGHIVDVQES